MSRGVLLDSKGRPTGRQGVTILVPGSYADEPPSFVCMVPGCDATFGAHEGREFQQHVGRCARENMDKIRQQTAPHPVLGEDFDPEVTKHMRTVVAPRMREEGRLTVKPSERAGF